ncbi:MAG: hypothetical protein E4G96_02430 [Chrysiogenales bacterium]|nr:MAG: hypothetical protein E4G96_02430 [Chrysiogenales bacterium]
MYVHAVSPFICDPVEKLDGLKSDLKNYTDFFFRRVNKFILLSLMGVPRCVHGKNIGTSTAVFLTTENGNLGDTENVLHQIYRENSFPKPFNFINTMSNTASFYVAQSLKSLGRSITVSSRNVSFERGLELAMADFELGVISEALVGGVDEAVFSREYFVKKYDASYHDVKLVEGSSWLYLTPERFGAMGKITDIRTFDERDAAIRWAGEAAGTRTVFAFGILMTPGEKEIWRKKCHEGSEFDYIAEHGYYDTAASFAVSTFIESGDGTSLIHVNRNAQGQYVVLACEKY